MVTGGRPELAVADPLVRIAYDESLRAVTAQAGVLDNLRSRASTVIAAASLVTAFLGGQALAKPSATLSHVEMDTWAWVAVGAFLGIGLLILAVLWPWKWRFVMSAKSLLASAQISGVTEDSMLADLARFNEKNYDANAVRLENLMWCFRGAILLLAVEALAWMMNLA